MGEARVDLLEPIRIIHEHLTAALCEAVFAERRVSERRRVWTLQPMAEFWTAVVLRAPSSLREALDEAYRGTGGFPHVEATSQAFFERAKGLRWEFFRDLLDGFTESVLADAPRAFERGLRRELAAFPEVFVVDGSGLDKVAHRLKVLWDERVVVLPGSLLVLHDLFRGLPRRVRFHEEAMGSEVARLESELDSIEKGTLLCGDRGFCSMRLFGGLARHGLFALVRCKKSTKIERGERLSRTSQGGAVVEDVLVTAGTKQARSEPQRLRLIQWKKGKKVVRLLTNVLDPAKLPAEVALRLYRRRWSIERMFYDLKEVLDLHRFYAANVNAVAMQVHAAALVYVALRVAQARIARANRIRPERLSVAKLFPRVAAASFALVSSKRGFLATCAANPRVELREPDWGEQDFASVPLASVLVEPRNGRRRARRYCLSRRMHASLHRFTRTKRRG